jgi:hypothetical protein
MTTGAWPGDPLSLLDDHPAGDQRGGAEVPHVVAHHVRRRDGLAAPPLGCLVLRRSGRPRAPYHSVFQRGCLRGAPSSLVSSHSVVGRAARRARTASVTTPPAGAVRRDLPVSGRPIFPDDRRCRSTRIAPNRRVRAARTLRVAGAVSVSVSVSTTMRPRSAPVTTCRRRGPAGPTGGRPRLRGAFLARAEGTRGGGRERPFRTCEFRTATASGVGNSSCGGRGWAAAEVRRGDRPARAARKCREALRKASRADSELT